MNYTLADVGWYSISTLRDQSLEYHLASLRKFYPDITVYSVDNNIGRYDIRPVAEKYSSKILLNDTLLSLTVNQTKWSQELFKSHRLLCFSADDVTVFEGGFIERAIELVNAGAEIVSFATEQDPIAYIYTERYFRNVGFNIDMPGKERTDEDLRNRVVGAYGHFPQVGEYWRADPDFWRSRYVGNPHIGKFGKDDVNEKLQEYKNAIN
jgi:hypothetical protein